MMENTVQRDTSAPLHIKNHFDMQEKEGTILAIDDELGPRESLRMLFKDDYKVVTAENGEQGIKALKEYDPDIIILDLRMPGKNGLETLEEIRDIDEKVPVIILTGYGDMEAAKRAIHLGTLEFISKLLVFLIAHSSATSSHVTASRPRYSPCGPSLSQ